jgi:hypothetical protein
MKAVVLKKRAPIRPFDYKELRSLHPNPHRASVLQVFLPLVLSSRFGKLGRDFWCRDQRKVTALKPILH